MNSFIRRAAILAGTLALAGGGLAAGALPASALAGDNFAYAASAGGIVNVDPVAEADYPDQLVARASHIDINHIVNTGNAVETATPDGSSSSTVAQVNVLGSLIVHGLTFRLVRTSCDEDNSNDTAIGSTTLLGIGGFGGPLGLFSPFAGIGTHPAPNTEVDLPGLTIVFNQQYTMKDTLYVTALSVTIASTAEQINIGTSACMNNRR